MTASAIRLPIVLLGAGGHARVVRALLKCLGYDLLGVCDPELCASGRSSWCDLAILGDDSALAKMNPEKICLANGVGHSLGSTARQELFERMRLLGFGFPALIHPTAWVADDVQIDEGAQIMAGVVIQPNCTIGVNSIVNTRSSVDHDCQIGNHVHVAPGATLCGAVNVAAGGFVGSGATVIQQISIGRSAFIGAGTTVVQDVPDFVRLISSSRNKASDHAAT